VPEKTYALAWVPLQLGCLSSTSASEMGIIIGAAKFYSSSSNNNNNDQKAQNWVQITLLLQGEKQNYLNSQV